MIVILGFGSRNWILDGLISTAMGLDLSKAGESVLFIHGGAYGADRKMAAYARSQHWRVRAFRPDYDKFSGHEAPLRRNIEMARFCANQKNHGSTVKAVGLWRDHSYGSLHMMNRWKEIVGEDTLELWYDCSCHNWIGQPVDGSDLKEKTS